MVGQGLNYVDQVRSASILLEASLISGDANGQTRAGQRLGELVGAPIAEFLITAGVGTALKGLQIGGRIINIVTNRDRTPDVDAPNTPDVDTPNPAPDPTNPTPGRANSPDTDSEAGAGGGARSPFQPTANLPDFPESAQRHIIEGEVRPNGTATGAHYPNSTNIRIDRSTVNVDPGGSGVFQANVSVRGPDGNFIPKSNNGGRSTFFPENWNADRVLREITAARSNPIPNRPDTFLSPGGVVIIVRTRPDGSIISAFPDFPQ